MAGPLSPELARQVASALAALRNRSIHRLAPPQRRAIYEAFGPLTAIPAARAQAWLAIRAAQCPLPIYRAETPFPITPSPQSLLRLARHLARGTLAPSAPQIHHALEHAYLAYGHLWVFKEIPWHVDIAVHAAYQALHEACAVAPPLSDLDESTILAYPDGRMVPSTEWSDEELADNGQGDAAGTAAVAYSWDRVAQQCNPNKMREYWEWWLTDALPKAWERAAHAPLP